MSSEDGECGRVVWWDDGKGGLCGGLWVWVGG